MVLNTAIANARIKAVAQLLTLNPLNRLEANLIKIPETKTFTKKESNPKVRILRGNLKTNPTVAFKRPSTSIMKIAFP